MPPRRLAASPPRRLAATPPRLSYMAGGPHTKMSTSCPMAVAGSRAAAPHRCARGGPSSDVLRGQRERAPPQSGLKADTDVQTHATALESWSVHAVPAAPEC
eukprot:1636593-Prymnesium_polylepis.1